MIIRFLSRLETVTLMNVLIVHVSPRRKGVTSTLLSEIQAAIDPAHKIETVRIHDLDITPCAGCMKCRPDRSCILPLDDAHALAEKVRWANFIIIGCPVYWGKEQVGVWGRCLLS